MNPSNQIRRCDVLIAGGGAAGAACARELISAGLEVVVLERAQPGQRLPCAGVLTPMAQKRLAEILDPENPNIKTKLADLYMDSYTGITFHFPRSGHSFTAGFKHGVARRVDRAQLNQMLLDASGANIIAPSTLQSFQVDGDYIKVKATEAGEDVRYQARALVGADGADSTVRSLLYPDLNGSQKTPVFRALRTVHRILDNPLASNQIHVWPEPRFGLLAWAHTWGERLTIGLLREEGEHVSDLHDVLIDSLETDHGVRLSPPDESADGRVFLGPAITSRYFTGRNKILLAGEAAGFINPPFEGLSTALSTGVIAGKAVANALAKGQNPANNPSRNYRALVADEARRCTDMWNPTRLLFGSPHEADLRAGFNALSQDAQHAVGNDLMRYMKHLKPYKWNRRTLWLGLVRVLTGRYPSPTK